MPEFQKAAKGEMQALAPEIRTAIEQRFGNVSAITDDVAKKMGQNMPFPKALLQAVRERDPAFAKEIESMLAPAEKKQAEAAEPEAKGVDVEARLGKTPEGAVAELSAAHTVSLGEETEASGKAGYVAAKGEGDFSAAVDVSSGAISTGIYRDPMHAVDAAAYVAVETEISAQATVGASAEAGVSEGEKYATVMSSVAFQDENGNISLSFSPMLTVSEGGELSEGIDSSAGYNVMRQSSVSIDVNARFYQADMVAGSEMKFAPTTSVGLKGSF